jgi:hypothetical protein
MHHQDCRGCKFNRCSKVRPKGVIDCFQQPLTQNVHSFNHLQPAKPFVAKAENATCFVNHNNEMNHFMPKQRACIEHLADGMCQNQPVQSYSFSDQKIGEGDGTKHLRLIRHHPNFEESHCQDNSDRPDFSGHASQSVMCNSSQRTLSIPQDTNDTIFLLASEDGFLAKARFGLVHNHMEVLVILRSSCMLVKLGFKSLELMSFSPDRRLRTFLQL